MRHFVYGLIFGASAMYFYTFHWAQVEHMKGYFDSWQTEAVEQTKGWN
jgi:hypothetical protein